MLVYTSLFAQWSKWLYGDNMPITEPEAIELALLRLCEILGEPVEHMPAGVALSLPDVGFDATARSGSHAFALN